MNYTLNFRLGTFGGLIQNGPEHRVTGSARGTRGNFNTNKLNFKPLASPNFVFCHLLYLTLCKTTGIERSASAS